MNQTRPLALHLEFGPLRLHDYSRRVRGCAVKRWPLTVALVLTCVAVPWAVPPQAVSASDPNNRASVLLATENTWGNQPSDLGNRFTPVNLSMSDAGESIRSFMLSAPPADNADRSLTPESLSRAEGRYAGLPRVFEILQNAFDDGEALRSEAEEDTAEQAAIWRSSGVMDTFKTITDPAIQKRARQIYREAAGALDSDYPGPQYSAQYTVGVTNTSDTVATYSLAPAVQDASGNAVPNASVTVGAGGGNELYTSVSGDNGSFQRIMLQEGQSRRAYKLTANIPLAAGVVLSNGNVTAITAQTIHLSPTMKVITPAASVLRKLRAIADSTVAANLSAGGQLLRWVTICALLGAVGIVLIWLFYTRIATTEQKNSGTVNSRLLKAFVVALALTAVGVIATIHSFVLTAPERPVGHSVGRETALPAQATGADSCYQPEGDLRYGYANLVDGKASTAWVSAANQGAGSLLSFDFGQVVDLTAIDLRNGLQDGGGPTDRAFLGNGRVTQLQLISDGGWSETLNVTPSAQQNLQDLPLPHTVRTRSLVIRISAITRTFYDVALSEIVFVGSRDQSQARSSGAYRGLPLAETIHTLAHAQPNCS